MVAQSGAMEQDDSNHKGKWADWIPRNPGKGGFNQCEEGQGQAPPSFLSQLTMYTCIEKWPTEEIQSPKRVMTDIKSPINVKNSFEALKTDQDDSDDETATPNDDVSNLNEDIQDDADAAPHMVDSDDEPMMPNEDVADLSESDDEDVAEQFRAKMRNEKFPAGVTTARERALVRELRAVAQHRLEKRTQSGTLGSIQGSLPDTDEPALGETLVVKPMTPEKTTTPLWYSPWTKSSDCKNRWKCPNVSSKSSNVPATVPELGVQPQGSDFLTKDSELGDRRRDVAKQMLSMFQEAKRAGGDINALPESGAWEYIESVVDSGATVSVMGPEFAACYQVQPSAGSKAGVTYQVANGDEVDNEGEKVVPVITDCGHLQAMKAQIAAVTTSLTSVRQLHKSGHVVVFDGPESFIINKVTGAINLIKDNGVNYTLGMTVVPPEDFKKMEAKAANDQGFHWPAK